MAQNQRLDTVANNIANAGTTGFKKDQNVFSEYLTANEKPPDVIQVPRVPASVSSFYDMQGGEKAYVDNVGTYTEFSQGALQNTGNALDLAIEGEGLFEVLTPTGVRYTRNGTFKVDNEGRLVNSQGHPVLMEGDNQNPDGRTIQVAGRNITVAYSGEIFSGTDLIGKISVVNLENKEALQKIGSSLYGLKALYDEEPTPTQNMRVHQGFLEMSNVNIVEEMTNMIQASRAFETNKQAIQAFDNMDEKLVNVVPRSS